MAAKARRNDKGFLKARPPQRRGAPPLDPTEELHNRPRAIDALIALRKADPKPMNASDLKAATGYATTWAKELRHDLQAWGMIAVEEGFEGKIPFVRMRLTPEGRRAADHAIAMREEMHKGKAKAERARKD